ncbi:MAG: hypothetical protein E6F97_06090 [Actinobacteria bacterium]|nr:MAG: hypothetical protein E6F97_06090 [Actinomycetota bacterium]
MERVAIIARLKEGSEQRAAELVRAGPPFDLADTGIVRHSIYISAGEAVDGQPRVARERFGWQLDVAAAGTARADERSESWA